MPEQTQLRQRGKARSPSPDAKAAGKAAAPSAEKLQQIREHIRKYTEASRPQAYWNLFVTLVLYIGSLVAFPTVQSYGPLAIAALGVFRGLVVVR